MVTLYCQLHKLLQNLLQLDIRYLSITKLRDKSCFYDDTILSVAFNYA